MNFFNELPSVKYGIHGSLHNPVVGINGFGRMGFCLLRQCIERNISVTMINAVRTPKEIAYLFEYDSVHGRYDGNISYDENTVTIDGHKILITKERDPRNIPWGKNGVEIVLECTGKFLTKEAAEAHLQPGVKYVVMSAPSKDDTPMFVYGVNHELFKSDMHIISNASCTTNCLAPLAKVIHEHFGIESGLMTTVHALTSKQGGVDGYNAKDLRIGRSGLNIIPSSTGAAKMVGKIIPELAGKLTGMSFRVPLQNVSVIDLTVNLEKSTKYQEICNVIKSVAFNEMQGIIDYYDEPVVSSDFNGVWCPCNFDATAGIMLNPKFVKLVAWYDNEMSYMNQMINLVLDMNLKCV